jgi:hypothetical protein
MSHSPTAIAELDTLARLLAAGQASASSSPRRPAAAITTVDATQNLWKCPG